MASRRQHITQYKTTGRIFFRSYRGWLKKDAALALNMTRSCCPTLSCWLLLEAHSLHRETDL